MAPQQAPGHLQELVRSLQQAMARLEEGKLGLGELDQCTEQARAVYERLVVLRHKAREATVAVQPGPPAAAPAPPQVAEPEPPAIRLDTRPPEAHPQQTSLIDAIAETESAVVQAPAPAAKAPVQEAARREPAKKQPAPPLSVADQLEQAPVADLRKAIALSQKFWFVAELFGGDRKRYEDALDALNAMATREQARAYMADEVLAKLDKPPGEEVVHSFTELLQRRFA